MRSFWAMSKYDCPVCGDAIQGEKSVVCEYTHEGELRASYEMFFQDIRSSFDRYFHPACYARENGVERLIELVEYRNRINREGFWKSVEREN